MVFSRCFCVCVVFFIFGFAPGAGAQQSAEVDPIGIGSRISAQTGIEGKLAELEEILHEIQQSPKPDLQLYFDLSTLRLELLLQEGRQLEAAETAQQLAQIAVSQRTVLNADPIPYLRRAATLFEAEGNYRKAITSLEAELRQRLDGGQSDAQLARLHLDLARNHELQGNGQRAEHYRKLAKGPLAGAQSQTRAGDSQGFHEVDVFYATDRMRTGEAEPADFYGYARGELEYGVVSVTIPDTHIPGAIETPSIWRLEFGPEPAKHVMVRKISPEEPDAYFARMQTEMAQRSRKEAFVFIHGFNTSFDAAAKRAAQLAYDMDYRGVPILYSWPSAGKTFMYVADTAVVRLSGRRLYSFLQDLKERSGADVVHIVAHSMGNRALTDALELLATRHTAEGKTEPLFGQIFFAAPDVDAGLFEEMLGTIRPLAQRMTLYTSQQDWALVASKKLHGDAPRAGQAGDLILTSDVFDTIDMSALGEDMLAHTYFANDSSALADIMSLIWLNAGPEQRCGMHRVAAASASTSWKYSKGTCPETDMISAIKLLWQQRDLPAEQIMQQLKSRVSDPVRLATLETWLAKLLNEQGD